MKTRWLLLLAALALLTGCNQQAWFDRFVPQEEAALAQRLLGQFAAKDFAAIEPLLSPDLARPEVRAQLIQVANLFPGTTPLSVEVVGAHTLSSPDSVQYDLSFQYGYPGQWIFANVVLLRNNGSIHLVGVHAAPLKDSLQHLHRFTLADKGLRHYLVLCLAVFIPLLVVATLVVCVKTPMPRRKWLWMVFISLGLMQFSLNWTDGSWQFLPIGFLLLGAGYTQNGPVAPYVLTIAAPVGAIVFWLRHHRAAQQPTGSP